MLLRSGDGDDPTPGAVQKMQTALEEQQILQLALRSIEAKGVTVGPFLQ